MPDAQRQLRMHQKSGASQRRASTLGARALVQLFCVSSLCTTVAAQESEQPCLCVFDVDRTLTGKQGARAECPQNMHMQGVFDSAYGGGVLALSEVTQRLRETFCVRCYVGIVSAGGVSGSGSAERRVIVEHLTASPLLGFGGETPQWSDLVADTPLFQDQPDGTKQYAVTRVRQWYAEKHIRIMEANTFFFDDRASNVAPFRDSPYNARQISCASRDHATGTGYCGARLSEILPTTGVFLCGDSSVQAEPNFVSLHSPPQVHDLIPTATINAAAVDKPPDTGTSASAGSVTVHSPPEPCLCVFDVDRTLTGKQGARAECPQNMHMQGVFDSAYGGGVLALSEVTQRLHETFCVRCYVGIVSAGGVSGSGSAERSVIVEHLTASPLLGFGGETPQWSDLVADTPLFQGQPDGTKQYAVARVRQWYAEKHIQIKEANTFFFDDRASNVAPFRDSPYNARQISCASRDHATGTGYCGARLSEILPTTGTLLCVDSPVTPTAEPVHEHNEAAVPNEADQDLARHTPAANVRQHAPVGLEENCGSTQCATAWSENAAGYTCGARIRWLRKFELLSSADACRTVAKEFPDVCGLCAPMDIPEVPEQHLRVAARDVSRGGESSIGQLAENAPAQSKDLSEGSSSSFCGSVQCESVWSVGAGGYSCGARIVWLQKFQKLALQQACNMVATEFPFDCGACTFLGRNG